MDTEFSEKVRQNRARRRAHRRGLELRKSRRRDPGAADHGGYMLLDAASETVVIGATTQKFDLSIDEIETFLADNKLGRDGKLHRRPRTEAPIAKQAAHLG